MDVIAVPQQLFLPLATSPASIPAGPCIRPQHARLALDQGHRNWYEFYAFAEKSSHCYHFAPRWGTVGKLRAWHRASTLGPIYRKVDQQCVLRGFLEPGSLLFQPACLPDLSCWFPTRDLRFRPVQSLQVLRRKFLVCAKTAWCSQVLYRDELSCEHAGTWVPLLLNMWSFWPSKLVLAKTGVPTGIIVDHLLPYAPLQYIAYPRVWTALWIWRHSGNFCTLIKGQSHELFDAYDARLID